MTQIVSELLLNRAIRTRKFLPTERRQDHARCMECDWSCGWDLNFIVPAKYAKIHQSETGHIIEYKVMLITERQHHYVIEAEAPST